ncbi:MAG: hypothetical protein IJF56_02680 [Clostridia bacterium]|nr:hypothetical protein [Clostridia bacterium]
MLGKKLACFAMAVLITLLTGCSQITETISSAVEKASGGDKEETQIESEDVFVGESRPSVGQLKEEPTPMPVGEEIIEDKALREYLWDFAEDCAPYSSDMSDKEWENSKQEWVDYLVDVKYFIDEKREIMYGMESFRPTIDFQGITYELRKTITEEELLQNLPNLVEGEPRIKSMGRKFEDGESITLWTRKWTEFLYNESSLEFLPYLDRIEFQGEYLAGIKVAEEGASVNGISVGDSREKIFMKYPMLKDEDQTFIYLYYYDGQVYTEDEYSSLFRDYDRYKSMFGDIEHWKFNQKYNTYVLEFEVYDNEIECIFLGDGCFAMLGH